MGSTSSRPRLSKVAPCNRLQEEGAKPELQWYLPALEQPSGSLGQRKTILPPLRHEITLSSFSEPCFAENLPPKQSNNSSIIHSHPPQRPKALQPLARQIGHTSTASQIAMGRNYRDGGVHLFSAIGQTGHSSTGRMIQGGFLEAQTALTQQAHRHRRACFRQAREHRRLTHKVVYSVNVGETNTEGIQRLKLVRRSTERDIFLDETTGESLDPSSLLDSKSLPPLCEARQRKQPDKLFLCSKEDEIQTDQTQGPTNAEEQTQQTGHRRLSLDQNLDWTTEIVRIEDSRDSWIWPESARSCQKAGIRGAGGIWDNKLD